MKIFGPGAKDSAGDTAMGAELKAMRRMLETQLAQLAWSDLTRRAPIHTEILTDLTEVGLSQALAGQIVAQLPSGTDLIKARRLSIALLSQRLNVTGDRWLDAMTFVAGKSAISDVFVGGKQVVNRGRHIKRASITDRYRRVVQRLATL